MMFKKIFIVSVQVIFLFQLFYPPMGNASIVRSDIPLKMPIDNWSLGMTGVNIHDNIFVSMPDRSLKFSSVDMEVSGIGFPLRLERVYTGKTHPKGMLGREWMLGIEAWVDQSTKDSITIIDANSELVFKKGDQNAFWDNNGTMIQKNGDRTILMTLKNGHSTLFSKDGRPIKTKEPNGNSLTYQYEKGRLTSIEESSGRNLLFFYNEDHLLEEVNDDTGRNVTFSYDSKGRLIGVNRFNVQKTTFNYDKESHLAGIVLPDGLAFSVVYEAKGPGLVKKITSNQNEYFLFEIDKETRDIKVSDHSGNSFNYSYYHSAENNIMGISNGSGWLTGYRIDRNGRLTAWQRPDGNLIRYWYDSLGRLVKMSDSAENTVEYKYNGLTNQFSQVTDSDGRKTTFKYDKKTNLVSITPPGQETIQFSRSPNGIIREQRQGDMIISSTTIDVHGNPVTVQSGLGGKTTMSYDSLGRITGEQTGDGPTYRYRYNDLDQITHILRNRDLLVEYSYDSMGNLKTVRDTKGSIFQYLYDGEGRLKKVKTPDNTTFTLQKIANRYQTKRLFPNNASKDYIYNHAGMLTSMTDPFGKFRQFKWTPSLQLDRIIDENGGFVRNKYDSAGKVIEKRYSSGESHLFRYKGSELISMESPFFFQEYLYNSQGQITAMKDKVLGLEILWGYDRLGKLESISAGGAGRIEYQYDPEGRIKSIIDPDSGRTEYIYDLSGRIKKIQYPNGVHQKVTYNEDVNAVNSIKVVSGSKILFHETYLYEKNGLLKEIDNKVDNTVKSYIYSADGKLVSYIKNPGGSDPKKWSYSYDGNGNMIEENLPDGKITSEYKGIGRITKHGKGRMHHDSSGNLTTAVLGRDKYNFEYDFNGRLRKAELPDGSFKEYRYDPLGRLIFYKKDGDERHILWNGNRRLLELDKEKKLVKFYVHGPDLDDVISIKRNGKFYFHQDRLASVRLVTDDRGKVVSSFEYTPFGKPLYKKSNSLSDGIIFGGRPYDSDIGCYYMRARFYNPTLKRFLTRDPLEGISVMPLTWHPYLYATNNPVNFNDPEGEIFAIIGATIFYGGAAAVSFGAGYMGGTIINKTYEEGKQIVTEGPGKYIKKAIRNKVDSVSKTADTIMHSGIHSYSAIKDGQEDEQEAMRTRLDNTKKFVETVLPMDRFQKEFVIQTNPDVAQRRRDHNENIAGYLSDSIEKGKDTLVSAGTKGLKEGTKIGRGLERLENLPGDLIGGQTEKVTGLTKVVDAVTNQAGNLINDARELAAKDAENNSKQPDQPETSNNVKQDNLFSVSGAEEIKNGASPFSVSGAEEVPSGPNTDCRHILGSTAVQGECICTDGHILSPSRGRCVSCEEYYQAAESAFNGKAFSAAQAIVNEAGECSWAANAQGLINNAKLNQVCENISANLQTACQTNNAKAVNGFMGEAKLKNCNIDPGLWQRGNSVISAYNQQIKNQSAAQNTQQPQKNQTNWMDVANIFVQGVKGVQQRNNSKPASGSGPRPVPQNKLPSFSTQTYNGMNSGVMTVPGAGSVSSSSNTGQSQNSSNHSGSLCKGHSIKCGSMWRAWPSILDANNDKVCDECKRPYVPSWGVYKNWQDVCKDKKLTQVDNTKR